MLCQSVEVVKKKSHKSSRPGLPLSQIPGGGGSHLPTVPGTREHHAPSPRNGIDQHEWGCCGPTVPRRRDSLVVVSYSSYGARRGLVRRQLSRRLHHFWRQPGRAAPPEPAGLPEGAAAPREVSSHVGGGAYSDVSVGLLPVHSRGRRPLTYLLSAIRVDPAPGRVALGSRPPPQPQRDLPIVFLRRKSA